jgi:MFS transporter, UMF1 family
MAMRKSAARAVSKSTSSKAIAGWVLFEWASQPFFTLITTFVYAPYFAASVASNPADGQALWGFAASAAGFAIAIMAPVLGSIADAAGRRKPWIAFFGTLIVIGSSLLWFGKPGDQSTIFLVLTGFSIGAVGAQCAAVFVNSMMPTLVPRERLGWLSGTGWAVGYAGGLVSLILVLGFIAASPQTGKTLLGFNPLFGLDAAAREGDRISGPLSAVWFILFALPLFLFTPDEPAKLRLKTAAERGLRTLWETVSHLPRYRNVFIFLIANMIYADGLVALFAFGGIYAAGTFGWSTIELGIFGILLTVTGTIGAYVGGKLDDKFGSKSVILVGLGILVFASLMILSITRDRIGFIFEVTSPVQGRGIYESAAEKAYVAVGLLIGLVVGPLQAASRTLLVHLAPKDRVTQFFGLFALSAKVTSFIGPFLVAAVTAATQSQRAGISVLVAFFLIGAYLLTFVRVSGGNGGRR